MCAQLSYIVITVELAEIRKLFLKLLKGQKWMIDVDKIWFQHTGEKTHQVHFVNASVFSVLLQSFYICSV